jgi:hypothetical protein
LIGGLVGTALGVLFFNSVQRAGQLETVISLSYMTLFLIIGGLMLSESLKALLRARVGKPVPLLRAGRHPPWLKWPLRMRFYRSRLYASVLPLSGFAAFIGFIGAVLGIGGGFLMVPALIYLFRVPTTVAVGTSLMQILVTMAASTVLHAVSNQSVDLVLAILLILGGVVGAQFGTRAARNVRGESFRLLLALLLITVGARFASEIVLPPQERFSITIQGAR